jgi:hypothetical protein
MEKFVLQNSQNNLNKLFGRTSKLAQQFSKNNIE